MSWLVILTIGEWIIRLVMIPVVLSRRFMPSTALGWLVLIFAVPEVGAVLYFLLGRRILVRKRARRHRAVTRGAHEARGEAGKGRDDTPSINPFQWPMVKQARRINGNPVVAGNRLELLHTNDELVEHLTADIDAAEHHAHLLYYIYRPDAVGRAVSEALIRAAGRGVRCRLIADAAGSRPFFRSSMYGSLHKAGVEVVAALPVMPWRRKLARLDLRNHRKVAVIDGQVGYTGSHNLVNEDYGVGGGKWVDLSGRLTGPVVAQLQSVFLDDWAYETDQQLTERGLFPDLEATDDTIAQTVATGPSYEAETFRRVLLTAFHAARERIVMTSPYLIPDEPMLLALAMAADRGVDVKIVTPRRIDHPLVGAAGRAHYQAMIEAGVEIYLYDQGMLHAKTMTIDDQFAMLGSANLDIRSFYLNFECNVLLYGPKITEQMRNAQEKYLDHAEAIDLDAWKNRPMVKRYLEQAAALLSPLL